MPHDRNGTLVKAGDRVVIRGTVKTVYPAENFCNADVTLDEPMPGNEGPHTISGINTRQFEVEVPPPEVPKA